MTQSALSVITCGLDPRVHRNKKLASRFDGSLGKPGDGTE
jgi:hypothetical protein